MLKTVKLDDMLSQWEKRLLNEQSHYIKILKDENEIKNTVLDLKFQRVIKNDCERTRVKERSLVKNFIDELEILLTFYCKRYDIKYKQGMNEILGPFILLKAYSNTLSNSKIFNLYSSFIYKNLTNYYHEQEFYSLQSSLGMLRLLIKYHEPHISNSLDHGLITPAMYATSWILTIFANKTKLDVLIYLWNYIIQENDELFVHFIVVGFLRKNKDVSNTLIIGSDYSQIPVLISTLSINTIEEVNIIYNNALKIRDMTPHSYRALSNNLCIFQRLEIDKLKFYFDFYHPDKLLTLPLLPSEVIYIAFNNIIECPDINCEKYTKKLEKLTQIKDIDSKHPRTTYINDYYCYNCKKKRSNSELSLILSPKLFILLDLRFEETSHCGFLPGTVILDKDDFMDHNFAEKLTQRFSFEKEKCHFVIITSETNEFFKFEEKFYKENYDPNSKKDTIPTRISKIICESEINKIKGFEIERKLREYDLFKKITKTFIKKNFPYVSFVFGGFKDIHNLRVPLLSHGINCIFCKKLLNRKNDRRKYSLLRENKNEQFLKKNEDFRKSMIVSSSNTNEFAISNKQEISPLVLDPHSNNYTLIKTNYSIDNVQDLLNDSKIKVFECCQLDYKNTVINCRDGSMQVLIFITKEDIKVLKLDVDDSFEESYYILLEKIFIKNVLTSHRKKEKKNIVLMTFISYLNDKMNISIELANDIESKQFINLLQSYKDVYSMDKEEDN